MKRTLLLALLLVVISSAGVNSLDFEIIDGKFHTSEGIIPNGCFGQLMTELNGDNSVAAIYINRANLRGCIAANFSYPGGNEDHISYEIDKYLGNNKYNLKVCTIVEGSLGRSCSRIIVQFKNREYTTPDGVKQVLSLEKLGEW